MDVAALKVVASKSAASHVGASNGSEARMRHATRLLADLIWDARSGRPLPSRGDLQRKVRAALDEVLEAARDEQRGFPAFLGPPPATALGDGVAVEDE